jgi:hypothetical protein
MQNAEAHLPLTINDPDAAICYEVLDDNGNYDLKWLLINGDSQHIQHMPNVHGTTTVKMKKLAHHYSFFACSVKYEITMDTFSSLLRNRNAR